VGEKDRQETEGVGWERRRWRGSLEGKGNERDIPV